MENGGKKTSSATGLASFGGPEALITSIVEAGKAMRELNELSEKHRVAEAKRILGLGKAFTGWLTLREQHFAAHPSVRLRVHLQAGEPTIIAQSDLTDELTWHDSDVRAELQRIGWRVIRRQRWRRVYLDPTERPIADEEPEDVPVSREELWADVDCEPDAGAVDQGAQSRRRGCRGQQSRPPRRRPHRHPRRGA